MRRLWLAGCAVLLGCSGPPPEQGGDVRIASLSPALTATIVQAGMGDHLVGRSAFCRDVDAVPVVGDLQNIHAERLVRLRPTHVLTQRSAEDVDPLLSRLAADHGWEIVAHPIVDMADVLSLIQRLPGMFPEEGLEAMCENLALKLRRAGRPVDRPTGRRVLIVGVGASLLAWGDETYLGQLVAAAGVDNLIKGRTWRTLSLEDLARLNPELLIVPSDAPHVDTSLLVDVMGEDRVRVLAFDDIEIPGPHLAGLRNPIRALLLE